MARNAELDEHSLITSELVKRHIAPSNDTIDAGELTERTAQLALVLDLTHQAFVRKEPAEPILNRLGSPAARTSQTGCSPRSGSSSFPWRSSIALRNI